jgi:triacylglycerol esterase/lipase EstA (alpha/beta hydrolase family)
MALLSLLTAAVLVATINVTRASAALSVSYSFPNAMAQSLATGAAAPAGANRLFCSTSSKYPRPIVLVHGTVENQRSNWNALAPTLKNDGACVYTLNYGAGAFTLGQFYGLDTVASGAGELKNYIALIKAWTGRSKVDIVGHSQGGVVARYYVQELGGASSVENVVSISAPHKGTTMSGIAKIADVVPGLADVFVFSWCKSCADQIEGSALVKKLNSKAPTASVKWTNIATKYDEIVTPYTNAFLSGSNVTNITLQDGCSLDYSEHLAISYSQRAIWNVRKALNPGTSGTAPCTKSLPLIGG